MEMAMTQSEGNIDLVFVVPVDLGQTTLLYKNQPAGKPLSIAR
jgi:hypothetical protein